MVDTLDEAGHVAWLDNPVAREGLHFADNRKRFIDREFVYRLA
jgi:hypothetical protein